MMVLALLLGCTLGFLGSIPIAGPVATIVFDRAIAGQGAEARAVGIGSAVAEGIYALLAFYGFTRLLGAFPKLVPVTRFIGAAIFVLLGLYLALRKEHGRETAKESHTTGRWLLGFSITALNPTVLLTWTGIIAALHATGLLSTAPLDALPFAAGVASGSGVWFWVVVWIVGRYRTRFTPKFETSLLRAAGGGLVIVGLFLGARLACQLYRAAG